MIDIADAYQKMFAGQMYPSVLLRILKGEDPIVTVKNVNNSVIMFSNGKILKCTNYYYQNLQETRPLMSNNLFLSCRNIRECLGINDIVGDLNCQQCHLQCIIRLQSHEIKRKLQKMKRRRKLYEKS